MLKIKKTFLRIYRIAKKKVRKRRWKRVIQQHHISYDPEVKVTLYKGEHWILCQLGRRTHITVGFIVSLRKWLREHQQRAIDLSPKKQDTELLEERGL